MAKKSFRQDLTNPAMQFISTPAETEDAKPSGATETAERPPKGYKLNPLYVETKNRRVQLLITPSLHARVKEAAERNGESFNAYINRVLDEATRGEE